MRVVPPEHLPVLRGNQHRGDQVTTDRLVRWTAIVAVLAVAAVAALISYRHAVDVVTVHGESGIVGHLYPVVIDGLIVAASMVLLDAARHREPAPPLAWWMLSAGIVATLAVNVLAGITSGLLGAIIAAWPALAFIGCYELLMLLVRASARRAAEPVSVPQEADENEPADALEENTHAAPENEPDPDPYAARVTVPTDAEHAALLALRATHAAGNPLSGRQLETRFGLSRTQATKVRKLALGDDGERHEDAAAKALLGLPDVEPARLRKLGEPDDREAADDAGALIPV
jgi:hypothetical protein